MKRLLFIAFMCAALAAGCSGGNGAVLQRAIDNFKPALLSIDSRLGIYEGALKRAQAYVDGPSDESLLSAKRACTDAMAQIAELDDAQSALSDADIKQLVDMGLNMADYNVPFEQERLNRSAAIKDMATLLFYLDKAPAQNDALKASTELMLKMDCTFRQVDYLCVNELFCAFSGEAINAFKDEFLPTLIHLGADRLPWDTDSAALMARADKLINDAEAAVEEYAAFLGRQYTILMEEEQALRAMLADMGYDDAQINNVIEHVAAE